MKEQNKKDYLVTLIVKEMSWDKERKSFLLQGNHGQEYKRFAVAEGGDEVAKALKLAQKYCEKFNKKMKRLYMLVKSIEEY